MKNQKAILNYFCFFTIFLIVVVKINSQDTELPVYELVNNNESTSPGSSTPSNPSTPTPPRISPIRTNVSTISGVSTKTDSRLGPYLTNDQGFSLYVNLKDGPNNIACNGDCLKKWPPAMITENQRISIAEELNGEKLMSMKADDGRTQLTYFDYPLYYYVMDVEPDEKKGQGIDNFYLISPKGQILKPDSSGRVPAPARNVTERNETSEEDTSSSVGESDLTKTLTISGTATMNILPDLVSIKFSLLSKSETLQSAFQKINENLINLNKTLTMSSSIDPTKIMLLDKIITQNFDPNNFNIFYIFDMISADPENLNDILTSIKEFNLVSNNSLTYDISYTVSNEVIKKAKNYLFSSAIKSAMENSLTTLDPAGMNISKEKPIRSISLDSSEMKTLMPFYNPSTLTSFPSLNKFNLMDMGASVTAKVLYIILINF